MPLVIGARLGRYEIVSPLGAGGAPAAMPSRGQATPRRGIIVQTPSTIDIRVMAVAIQPGTTFAAGNPQILFELAYSSGLIARF